MDKKKNKYDVDIPKEVLDAFARYIIPEIRRFHESEEGQAFYKEWLEKHPEYAEKIYKVLKVMEVDKILINAIEEDLSTGLVN